eukprot:gnl/TRDRNA2_/TRDRNA2_178989_c0_seq1.p1 gnl/TRDRNA2_/TRDRNA2_178989_c0~~gnl/TRDRNA2_/TRDRNA2_178989_c0_seq1.p1  ORF type:complete len:212 (+),score=48.33 gnl/TRDRNA2_/TRDRNA2_178989_c0_seq1:132-767(+)
MPHHNDQLSAAIRGHKWQVKMFDTPCEVPGKCCYGCFCPCCFAFQQRNEILDITGEPYVCCGGICPCGPFGKPQKEDDKPVCLCMEVTCCTSFAVAGNRFMIQTRFMKENDACDDCIILFANCLSCFATILAITGVMDDDATDCMVALADCVNCSVMGCMLSQQQVELEKVKEEGYGGIPDSVLRALSPHQQEMISCKKNQRGKAPGQQRM